MLWVADTEWTKVLTLGRRPAAYINFWPYVFVWVLFTTTLSYRLAVFPVHPLQRHTWMHRPKLTDFAHAMLLASPLSLRACYWCTRSIWSQRHALLWTSPHSAYCRMPHMAHLNRFISSTAFCWQHVPHDCSANCYLLTFAKRMESNTKQLFSYSQPASYAKCLFIGIVTW